MIWQPPIIVSEGPIPVYCIGQHVGEILMVPFWEVYPYLQMYVWRSVPSISGL
ncbi:uncharacterized protein THITE_2109378 [Thermothielavioides terrestris NRRL 8126]|uniref:Uncharacterized protein n=1 Tax=Thermothielavioides terrestris (strain ATCC 38088 / NRRL 8126) TaxID=578455 RepID=G2QV91_THETT|nr:uncharacterized protein THITE_2109378 [Thermothielavioides terrestris NRRL 8126]AEO63778.1 hypothetical protein THITE_2109378 [Thermothielavioides terrestris NRRL 8126]